MTKEHERDAKIADSAETDDRVDQLASDIDDLQTVADEIQERPPAGATEKSVKRLKRALSDASAAADDIEDETKE